MEENATDATELEPETTNEESSDAPEGCTSSCSSCGVSDCGERNEPEKLATLPQAHVKHVIAVVSGKGGVGKSLVTSQLAAIANKKGYKVGVLDADITGPTMARAFGITNNLRACAEGIIPQETPEGIKIVSTNMVLPEETTPVLWRGSIINKLVNQFFAEVLWEELDYLFIDMPPGTGDVALTVFQTLPIDGIVIVTAPQDLVSMIVGKAINMAEMMKVPVLGIVENLSYFKCPDCGSEHKIFGQSDIKALADEYNIGLSVSLPLDASFAEKMDKGEATKIELSELEEFAESLFAE